MKKEFYSTPLEVSEMADWLNISLWGNTPTGDLRVSKINECQPTGIMTYQEIVSQFNKFYETVNVRPGGRVFKVVPKATN